MATFALVRKMLLLSLPMDAEAAFDRSASLADAEHWPALEPAHCS